MHFEQIRSLGPRLEQYFDWYRRQEPDVPQEAASVVDRFVQLVRGPANAEAARRLLQDAAGFDFGTLWEEMRLALLTLAYGR